MNRLFDYQLSIESAFNKPEPSPLVATIDKTFDSPTHLYQLGFSKTYNEVPLLKRQENYSEWTNQETQWENLRKIIMFIGQTGVGKSTTINTLMREDILPVSEIECCTKRIHFIDINVQYNKWVTFCDMPGIGESDDADSEYERWYREMAQLATLLVYVIKADDRAQMKDLNMLRLLRKEVNRNNFILGISQIDKINPCREWDIVNHLPSENQRQNIERKIKEISRQTGIPESRIIAFSNHEHYNLNNLIALIDDRFSKRIHY